MNVFVMASRLLRQCALSHKGRGSLGVVPHKKRCSSVQWRSCDCPEMLIAAFVEMRWGYNEFFDHWRGVFIMKISTFVVVGAAIILAGCASVEMATKEESAKAKEFNPPSQGNAGVYIYRDSFLGKALKKDIWIDGKCIGESAPNVFFYTEVEGGKTHNVDTESEFSPNTLAMMFESGKNYFIRQFIKMGVFVGGAGVEQVPEEQGKEDVARLKMAKTGKCSSAR
ncbi:MAG: DUF2846 domain-containing protein [Zoogloeaceae bacterium]|nr:DUF2846 domain-containing protein [Zoogloeaceae bacterium]